MPNSLLTAEYVLNHVTSTLGGDNVDVESNDNTILVALRKAVAVYNRYRPQYGKAALQLITNVQEYTIVAVNTIGVADVSFVPANTVSAYTDPSDPFVAQSFNQLDGVDQVGLYAQQQAYRKDVQNVAGIEPTWEYYRGANGAHLLYIACPADWLCSYTYTYKIDAEYVPVQGSPSGYGDYGLKLIPESDVDWFLDYMTNRVQYAVGMGLRKFGGIPSPDGGVGQLHGDAWVNESLVAEKDLLTEIQSRRVVAVPDFG